MTSDGATAGDGNLYALLARSAADAGDKPLIVEEGRVRLRYDELDERTGRLAARLRQHGARPGDRIVVQVEKSVENVLLYLASLRAGLVYVPLNTAYTAAEVNRFIADTEPALVVGDTARGETLQRGNAALLTLDPDGRGTLLAEEGQGVLPVEPRSADDLACILYTSGTTGRSKGAMLSHGNLASNALALHVHWQWRRDDALIHALPIYHVHGLFVALHGALVAGATIRFHAGFDAGAVLADLPRATVMMGVPTFYTRLLHRADLDAAASRSMRLFVSGSAPLPSETFDAFRQRTGHAILERYGMTETGMMTSNPYDGDRVAGTVGYPLPGIEIRLSDDGGPVADDGVGVVEVRGANVFKGYWRMPERTAAEFREDGFFVTGDIGTLSADGRLTLVGRAKDLIISGGLNIYPKEVEQAIDGIEGIGESAVIGVPHPDLGEAALAVVVRTMPQLTEEDVLARLGDLARFKRPRSVMFVDELPRNAMGKVQKAEMRAQHARLFAHAR